MTTTAKTEKYIEGVGKRKTSIARVRITPNTKTSYTVNSKAINEYFTVRNDQEVATEAIRKATPALHFSVSIMVNGGGVHSKAEAIKLGLARAIVSFDKEYRKQLKDDGLLTRDARIKERRKFGLKKARKAPQWSKR